MADEATPENSGTTGEQDDHRLDGAEPSEQQGPTDEQGDGLAVQAVDEADHEQEQEDGGEMDMAEELDEAIEMLEALRDDDPENVGTIAVVVNTKNGMPQAAVDAKGEDAPEGEDLPDGTTWRVVNSSLEGYDDVDDVVATLAAFNSGLGNAEVQMERPSGPAGLGAMLGLE